MYTENNRYRFEDEEENKNEVKSEKKEKKESKTDTSEKDHPNDTTYEKNTEFKNNKNEKKDKYLKQIDALKKEKEELKQEIEKLKNDILKVKADEVNFKKRIEEEKDRSLKYANQAILEKFVNQLDLFDKVVNMPTDDPVLKNYLLGFEMINNNLKQVLEEEGVKKIKIKELEDKLDPRFHHALQTEWNEEYEENVILKELQSGYMYKDRVLRPVLVKVNKKEGK